MLSFGFHFTFILLPIAFIMLSFAYMCLSFAFFPMGLQVRILWILINDAFICLHVAVRLASSNSVDVNSLCFFICLHWAVICINFALICFPLFSLFRSHFGSRSTCQTTPSVVIVAMAQEEAAQKPSASKPKASARFSVSPPTASSLISRIAAERTNADNDANLILARAHTRRAGNTFQTPIDPDAPVAIRRLGVTSKLKPIEH